MTLVDSSVWIQHFLRPDPELAALLEAEQVLMHPFVFGELSLGRLHARETLLRRLRILESTPLLSEAEVEHMVHRFELWGRGIGWVDCHLIASAQKNRSQLLTRDKALKAAWLHVIKN
jgi:predicted nucleic acid-binding protein